MTAVSGRTIRPLSSETSAAATAMPALAPSSGVALRGTSQDEHHLARYGHG